MAAHSHAVIAVNANNSTRRKFSSTFKQELVEQTLRRDVSLARVALANGINTNLLSRWRREYVRAQSTGCQSAALIPVRVVDLPTCLPHDDQSVDTTNSSNIEVRHGNTSMIIRGTPDAGIVLQILGALLPPHSGVP